MRSTVVECACYRLIEREHIKKENIDNKTNNEATGEK